MNVLAFAAEAWETKLMLGILRDEATFKPWSRKRIALTDVHTLQYEWDFLSEIQADADIEVSTMEREFVSWQIQTEFPEEPTLPVKEWLRQHRSRVSRRSLMNSDIILTPWEQGVWGLPINESWRERIAADILLWAERQFDEVEPDLVLCVERRRLATLGAQVIAENRGVPILSLIYSRVSQRWVVRMDGGIGMTETERKRMANYVPSEFARNEARRIVAKVRSGSPLYESASRTTSGNSVIEQGPTLINELSTMKRVIHGALVRHLHPRGGHRAQRFKAIRYDQSFPMLTAWEFRVAFIRAWMALGGLRDLQHRRDGSTSPYVLWLLHKRPEDSVAAVGGGDDEGQAIARLRLLLPQGVDLVVKEHPAMFGWRDKNFYSKLRGAGVEVVGSRQSTSELMMSCAGMAGLSGTGLLEAALLGVPTITFGQPEYQPCISHHGWEQVAAFVDNVQRGSGSEACSLDPIRYLEWNLDNSDPSDVYYQELDPDDWKQFVKSVAQRFHTRFSEWSR